MQADEVAINWKEQAILAGACTWGTDAVDRPTVRQLIARTIPRPWPICRSRARAGSHPALFARAGAAPAARKTLTEVGGIVVDLPTLFADLTEV